MKRYRMIILPVKPGKHLVNYVNSFLEKFDGESTGIVNIQMVYNEDHRFVHIWYWIYDDEEDATIVTDTINDIENDEQFPLLK